MSQYSSCVNLCQFGMRRLVIHPGPNIPNRSKRQRSANGPTKWLHQDQPAGKATWHHSKRWLNSHLPAILRKLGAEQQPCVLVLTWVFIVFDKYREREREIVQYIDTVLILYCNMIYYASSANTRTYSGSDNHPRSNRNSSSRHTRAFTNPLSWIVPLKRNSNKTCWCSLDCLSTQKYFMNQCQSSPLIHDACTAES